MDPRAKIAELEAEIERLNAQIGVLSVDCVSGLQTRHDFESRMRSFKPRRKGDKAFGVVMCDIDYFKRVNDEHGHRMGDEVIAEVAKCIKKHTRGSDTVARYGGEEFVAVISHADKFGLSILSERLRIAVEDLKVETECHDCSYCHDGHHPVTISVGFTMQHETDESGWDVVERADAALMAAKRLGRNRVESDILGNEEVLLVNKIEDAR